MTVFYFTATGNCLALAKRIGGNLISIPQVVNSDHLHYKDDVIGIVFPVYFLREPRIVRRFLDKANLDADYTFSIATYGFAHGTTLGRLQKRARKNGLRFDYTNYLITVDNYLPGYEMGAQIAKQPEKKVEEQTVRIADDIESRKRGPVKEGLFNRVIGPFSPAFYPKKDTAKSFVVNSQCNQCGTCCRVCPVKNITISDQVHFHDHCEVCLSCAHLCPKNAIHLPKERSSARWRNPDVSIAEIISANNQNK